MVREDLLALSLSLRDRHRLIPSPLVRKSTQNLPSPPVGENIHHFPSPTRGEGEGEGGQIRQTVYGDLDELGRKK